MDLKFFNNMSKTKVICLVLFVLFVGSLAFCLLNRKNLINTQLLKERTMSESFANSQAKFTMYYVDWCPHCVSTKPHFKNLMNNKELKNLPVKVSMVNCEENPKEAERAGVESYPTIKLEKNNKMEDYPGERTVKGMLNWLKKKL